MFSLTKKLLLCLSLLHFQSTIYAAEKLSEEEMQAVIVHVKEKYNAVPVAEPLKTLVDEAIKVCGLNQEVIFFESETMTESITCRLLNLSLPVKCILINTCNPDGYPEGTPRRIDHIKFSLYHEIGHVINRDLDSVFATHKNLERYICYGVSLMLGSLAFGCAQTSAVNKSLLGIGGSLGTFFLSTSFFNYLQCLKEDAADTFAYNKLLSQGTCAATLNQIAEYLSIHDHYQRPRLITRFLRNHPSHLDRALNGLNQLEKNGYNIKELLANQPTGYNQFVYDMLKKYAPHYYKTTIMKD